MGYKEVKLYRVCWIIFGVCVLIVGIVILSLQWRTVDILNYGLLYNSGKKAVELDQLYLPGRYYVGAGSYFLEFPSIQKAIIFKSDNKQNFATDGTYTVPIIKGLTLDGLILQMSLVVNYKLLDRENTAVTLQNQLFSIFNTLYGGNIKEEISDTIELVAEAGILETITQYLSSEFYQKRAEVQWNIYLTLKAMLKDYYITCTGVSIVNMEFDSDYQTAIAKISAEAQLIEEKSSLLEAEKIAAATNVAVATTSKDILVSAATNVGTVYGILMGQKASAVTAYYGKLGTSVGLAQTIDGATTVSSAYNFYYMLAMKMTQAPESIFLYQTNALYTKINT